MAPRSRFLASVAALALVAVVGCSKSTPSSEPAPGPTTAATDAPTGLTGDADASGGSPADAGDPGGGGTGTSDDGERDDAGGSGTGSGAVEGTGTQSGLTTADVDQLRSTYVDQGVPAETADCIVAYAVAALEGTAVTQDALVAALTDAVITCGAAPSAGGDLVGSIIDNYPSGGAPVSTTIVAGGGDSPVDNFPSGG